MTDQLKCGSCGAPLKPDGLNWYRCEYCGTVYQREEGIHLVEVVHSPIQQLKARIAIPFEAGSYMSEKDLAQYSIRELTCKLAEGLAAYMKLDVRKDPCEMATIVYGSVRIIPPDHRF